MSTARSMRHLRIEARDERHVRVEIDLAHAELSTNLSDGTVRAQLSLDARDALSIAERLFGAVWMLAREHARRIAGAEQRRRLQ
jgi:hypothetical protein